MKNKVKILVVDDQPGTRQKLTALINQEADLTVCGEAKDAHQALEMVSALKPDLAVISVSIKGIDGIEMIKKMKRQSDCLPLLVLSIYDELIYIERVIRAGARGYVMTHEATETVVKAIHQILNGEIFVSDTPARKIIRGLMRSESETNTPSITHLSNRELEVFQLIKRGYCTLQIADHLCLSVETIESYRASIRAKLNLKDFAYYASQCETAAPEIAITFSAVERL